MPLFADGLLLLPLGPIFSAFHSRAPLVTTLVLLLPLPLPLLIIIIIIIDDYYYCCTLSGCRARAQADGADKLIKARLLLLLPFNAVSCGRPSAQSVSRSVDRSVGVIDSLFALVENK